MSAAPFRSRQVATARHRTAYLEAGPAHGPLMILVHGWPELGLIWEHQLRHFAAAGWRCIAPDMRGYGGSSVPDRVSDYQVRAIVDDLLELHDSLGAAPALWVAHDWGCAPAWGLAARHPGRCRGVVALSCPYFPLGLTAESAAATVDRTLYPHDRFPVGQWDYWHYHRERSHAAAASLDADVRATLAAMYRRTPAEVVGRASRFADVRARGGFFGAAGRAPAMPRDETMFSDATFEQFVAAFEHTGFRGANAWYLNDAANAAYAAEAPRFGRIDVPVLFLHGRRDTVCDTVHSALAEPMRGACADLSEVTLDCGHMLMLEEPGAVNAAIERWATAPR
ncbi:alpha/beta fold hydrolase [Sphingomonas sp. BK580]|uniref:alpha/beta fold hydrolase n=1 Tax=Sphingomonas sp. BK580 TaxID=2586972 RepID=UPI00179E9190|nr:alpha/beta hydrolase [Sphingomonas sp. BK580]MBB3692850.1 pimeloyl-ACP methyl ester carboxylesterase [Sphingomonas sp. BK580]